MKSYYEERGGTYTQIGDALLPDLVMYPQPEGEIGVRGRRRKQYLKEHRKGVYNAMPLNGTLTRHLIDANTEAIDHMDNLVKQMARAEGMTEDLKRRDQLGWEGRMNSIRDRAEEIVRNDLIYS